MASRHPCCRPEMNWAVLIWLVVAWLGLSWLSLFGHEDRDRLGRAWRAGRPGGGAGGPGWAETRPDRAWRRPGVQRAPARGVRGIDPPVGLAGSAREHGRGAGDP